MFPYADLEDWFGARLEEGVPRAISRLSLKRVNDLADFTRSKAWASTAAPPPHAPGLLRPNIATMRTLDIFWGPGPLLERSCAVLTYAHAATMFDPFSFTVEEWARSPDRSEFLAALPDLLARAAELLIEVRPLVESRALDLVPPALTRDFGDDLPEFTIDHDLMTRYAESGLSERIGDFNRQLGAAHSSGRYRGYQHLWEIHQDLLLVDRYPDVLEPLFVAGFDSELASLLLARSAPPATRHAESLAAFRFPILQVTPRKVGELRALDEFSAWRQSLQTALTATDAGTQGLVEVQASVAETLRPTAERLVESLRTRWTDIRWTGVEQFLIGGLTTSFALGTGTDPAVASVTGAATAALTTGLTSWKARGRRTTLDVPFLSMTPDNARYPPSAIPKMGLL